MPRGPRGLDPFPDNAWGRYLASTVAHLGCASWSEDDFGIAAKHYYASISLIDHGLGWILDALRSSGREESTWLLVSSDHGDLLGDHGFYAKRVFYDGAVRIPQIVVPPPGEGGGIATDALTQGFDLPATILDLAGARPDPSFRGRSLLPALSGESVGRAVVYSEIDRFLLVTTAQHKLVVDRSTGEPQAVYDRRGDPDERENLLGTSRGRAIVVALADHVAAFPGSEPSR
jgi:choline-sulfatase